MIVSAFAVFAVVGSALAFTPKAQRFCHYVLQPNGTCPLVNQPFTATQIGAGSELIINKPGTGCPVQAPQACDKAYTNLTFNQ